MIAIFRYGFAAVVFLALAHASQAETLLRLTFQFPMNHPLGVNLQSFADEVAQETNGEVRIEIYPSSQLFKDNEVPQAVGSGAIEMGSASLTRLVGDAPVVDAFYVPFLFEDAGKVAKALAPGSEIRAILDEEILKSGSRVLYYQANGGAIILSKGENAIVLPEHMKGKLVRSFGATISDTIEAVGGSPTIISGGEQFLAYQNGTVDAGMTGITTVPVRRFYEVMDHVTMTNHAAVEFVVLVNNATWESLSPEHREIVSRAAERAEKQLRDGVIKEEEDARAEVEDKINIIDLTDEQRAAWRDATKGVVDAFIRRAGEPGRRVVDAASQL